MLVKIEKKRYRGNLLGPLVYLTSLKLAPLVCFEPFKTMDRVLPRDSRIVMEKVLHLLRWTFEMNCQGGVVTLVQRGAIEENR